MRIRRNPIRIALMISMIFHLAVLLTMRGLVLFQYTSPILDSIRVELVESSKPTDNPPPRISKREIQPVKKIRELSPDPPAKNISFDRPPDRTSKIRPPGEDLPEAEIPAIDTKLKIEPSLSSPFGSVTTTTASGSSLQGKGTGTGSGGSGGGGRGYGGLVSVEPRKAGTDNSIIEKLHVQPETDLPFGEALQEIAQHVVDAKSSRKVDITFIVDKSESMQNDIDAVRKHLNKMIDSFRVANMDFTLGVVSFHHSAVYEWLGIDVSISSQTSDVEEVRKILKSIRVSGGERALDALMRAIEGVKFRPGADRHFILITDEYVKGTYQVRDVLRAAKRANITIDVIGRNEPFQTTLAEQTGGIWMSIHDVRGEKQ